MNNDTVEAFHRLYYNDFHRTWEQTYWLGHKVLKCPLDLWVYQEILHRVQPDLVVECGTAYGGSALFLASMLDLLGGGEVITIDIADPQVFPRRPAHPRITYLHGNSVAPAVLDQVHERAQDTVLVILDSDHRQEHVAQELEAYAPLVTAGSYLIVEDTNVNGHPVELAHGAGPMEALELFLVTHSEFEVDRGCEKFFLTFNPSGYLRRRS
jgi:cephalosporin hydroxylase